MKRQIYKTWSRKDQAEFLSKLSQLITSGYTLIEALTMMNIQLSKKQNTLLKKGIQMLIEGEPFYVVLEEFHFQREVIAIICFSEKHGSLRFALEQSALFLKKKLDQMDTMKRILRYPLFLIFTICAVFALIHTIVLPQFSFLYTSMGIESSMAIQLIFIMFQFLQYFLLLFCFVSLCIFCYYVISFKKKSAFSQMTMLSRIPILKKGLTLMHTYFFSLQLSGLLHAGLSIYDSLLAFKNQTYLPFLKELSEHMIKQLKKGEPMEEQVNRYSFFDQHFASVIQHGEASGQLARELYTYSQFLLENVEFKIEKWMSILQPAIYAITAVLILVVYLSILLPMYQLMEHM
ncbi:competence type IV pilus assembly protein ComGB [Bacillus sp. NPDC077027]|uniref:competence type IV pilus assembly protein ComGB n=1 Tax=Bacillus sp. NPDC077027 TaxID=3390548 RepID=UPI003D08A60A